MKTLMIAFEAPASQATIDLLAELSDRGYTTSIQAREEEPTPKQEAPKKRQKRKQRNPFTQKRSAPAGQTVASVIYDLASRGDTERRKIEVGLERAGYKGSSFYPQLRVLRSAHLAEYKDGRVKILEAVAPKELHGRLLAASQKKTA